MISFSSGLSVWYSQVSSRQERTHSITVLIHGLVRDSQGRKMSKSLGNGIDPLEVIDKYGADALRMTLMTGNAPGNDMRFYWERVEAAVTLQIKYGTHPRFIMMNMEKAVSRQCFTGRSDYGR